MVSARRAVARLNGLAALLLVAGGCHPHAAPTLPAIHFEGGDRAGLGGRFLASSRIESALNLSRDQIVRLAKLGFPSRSAKTKIEADFDMATPPSKVEREAAAILKPDQVRRLCETEVGLVGARALLDPAVATWIGATPGQKARIDEIAARDREARQAIVEMLRTQGSNGALLHADLKAQDESVESDLRGLLAASQRYLLMQQFEKTTGHKKR